MKKIGVGKMGGLFICVLIFLLTISRPSFSKELSVTITTKGEASLKLSPDICDFNFSIITEGKDQPRIIKENGDKMKRLINSLKNLDYDLENIETESIDVVPVYSYENKKQELIGYKAENRIRVRSKHMDKIGHLIDYGIKNGASSVGYLTYGSSKTVEAYEKVLGLAVRDGINKAEAIGKSLGKDIKGILSIEEVSSNYMKESVEELAMDNLTTINSSPVIPKSLTIRASVKVESYY